MSHNIEKKSILSGSVEKKPDDPWYKKLKKVDAGEGENVKVKNPFTGKEVSVFVDRKGTTDERVAAVMIDPSMTRDHKDLVVSQWLFERGLESASFIAELFRYKGEHTKETRAFKSQMRFDYELVVQALLSFYRSTSVQMFSCILPGADFESAKREYLDFSKEKSGAMKDFLSRYKDNPSDADCAVVVNTFQMAIEADLLDKKVEAVTKSRMSEKGWGIYIDSQGKPYSVRDGDILAVVEEDKKRVEDLINEEKYERAIKPGDGEG